MAKREIPAARASLFLDAKVGSSVQTGRCRWGEFPLSGIRFHPRHYHQHNFPLHTTAHHLPPLPTLPTIANDAHSSHLQNRNGRMRWRWRGCVAQIGLGVFEIQARGREKKIKIKIRPRNVLHTKHTHTRKNTGQSDQGTRQKRKKNVTPSSDGSSLLPFPYFILFFSLCSLFDKIFDRI